MRKLIPFVVVALAACKNPIFNTLPGTPTSVAEEGSARAQDVDGANCPLIGAWVETSPPYHNFLVHGHLGPQRYKNHPFLRAQTRSSEMVIGFPPVETWASVTTEYDVTWQYTFYWTGNSHPFNIYYKIEDNITNELLCYSTLSSGQ